MLKANCTGGKNIAATLLYKYKLDIKYIVLVHLRTVPFFDFERDAFLPFSDFNYRDIHGLSDLDLETHENSKATNASSMYV